jgi:glutathione synthase/RimK-type ligase-like ATP-grasp enzyme
MIGLVTYPRYPRLTDDDRPLIGELGALGASASPVIWSDPEIRWRDFDALVLRSCWDYHLRPDEFRRWLEHVERDEVPLWNPASTIRWNMHKRYLHELGARGVLVPGTEWLRAGDDVTLAAVLNMRGWTEAIVKPAISASAMDTWRTSSSLAADEKRFAEQLRRSDLLVQTIVPEVATEGEWSLIYIAGAFSHAMLKRPSPGDFRVQVEHGGSAVPVRAPDAIVAAGADIVAQIPGRLLFARIDGVVTPRGFMLMEAECIEPQLFFEQALDARTKFARALFAN